MNGHLECLKYAHENGCPWDEKTCIGSSSNASWHSTDSNTPYLECLQYAYQNKCPGSDKYYYQIKDRLLQHNLKMYYAYWINRLIIRKYLRSYIKHFRDRYYAPGNKGSTNAHTHFTSLIQ